MIRTGSGIPVEESYGEERAGDYPFTRGIRETMYRGRLWTMRQYAGLGDAEASNQRYKFLLGEGTTGLSVAFDLPTQIGFDSDDAMALGEVGRVGVAIDSLEDMERLFAGIPLDRISTSMTINATASILLAMYFVAARRAGVAGPALRGTVQNDILKEYVARGTYIYPVRQGLRLVTDSLSWAAAEMPAWNAISVSGYHLREAGATAVQELAFTLANARSYVRAAIAAGMEVDAFAPRLSFFFSAHNDLFEEVAKFRAGRRMWAKMMREEFGRDRPAELADAVPYADRGEYADRRAGGEQRGADDGTGAGRRPGRDAEPAYQWLRRGAWSADRDSGAHRVAHPAGDRV